jgi:hypothetical protein
MIDALNAQLDKAFESRRQLKAARSESERTGNPAGEIPRAEPSSICITRREGGMEKRDALLVLMTKLSKEW